MHTGWWGHGAQARVGSAGEGPGGRFRSAACVVRKACGAAKARQPPTLRFLAYRRLSSRMRGSSTRLRTCSPGRWEEASVSQQFIFSKFVGVPRFNIRRKKAHRLELLFLGQVIRQEIRQEVKNTVN
jgi:hypothetical protein